MFLDLLRAQSYREVEQHKGGEDERRRLEEECRCRLFSRPANGICGKQHSFLDKGREKRPRGRIECDTPGGHRRREDDGERGMGCICQSDGKPCADKVGSDHDEAAVKPVNNHARHRPDCQGYRDLGKAHSRFAHAIETSSIRETQRNPVALTN